MCPALLESHRQAGRLLVLATTTPYDLVEPLARRLGFDHVIATRYGRVIDREGVERYTGGIEGGFVWSLGKLQAVRRWADAGGIDLRQSWAYSDSVYDLPLLSAVGHPTAVNPDFRLQAVAVLRRWPVVYLDARPGCRSCSASSPWTCCGCCSSRRDPLCPLRHRGDREHPAHGAGHRGRQPPQLLRSRRLWTGGVRGRTQPERAGQEGVVRCPRDRHADASVRGHLRGPQELRPRRLSSRLRRHCATARC